jgi:hypothetical protein
MGCQRNLAGQNHRWQGQYLFSLIGNQTGLLEEVKSALAALIGHGHEFVDTVFTSARI